MTGLHGRAERCGRGVKIYLLPSLTTGQRRAVLRRLRQEASRGLCPPLPLPQLAIALGLDRARRATRVAAAIVRLHPAVSLVPTACIVAAMALFIIASSGGAGGTRGAPKAPAALANKAGDGGGSSASAWMKGVTVAHGIHARVAVGAMPPRTSRFSLERRSARR